MVKISWGFDVDPSKSVVNTTPPTKPKGYIVRGISRNMCAPFILRVHYAKRMPSITYAYGLFEDGTDELCGIITYGSPVSSPLMLHLAGIEYKEAVIELSRLVLKYNRKNEASILVGRSIKLLPKGKIIVSFADTGQDHVGCVYQATNFLYTGLSMDASDMKLKGKEKHHNIRLNRELSGIEDKQAYMRETYGDLYYKEKRTRKHRYVYLHGSKTFRKKALKALKYPVIAYPKGSQKP